MLYSVGFCILVVTCKAHSSVGRITLLRRNPTYCEPDAGVVRHKVWHYIISLKYYYGTATILFLLCWYKAKWCCPLFFWYKIYIHVLLLVTIPSLEEFLLQEDFAYLADGCYWPFPNFQNELLIYWYLVGISHLPLGNYTNKIGQICYSISTCSLQKLGQTGALEVPQWQTYTKAV